MKHDTSLSVTTSLKGLFRMQEEDSEPQFCARFLKTENHNLREALLTQGKQPEILLRFLIEMDKKLDAILGRMQEDDLESTFPHEGHVLSLSTAGAVFVCREPLAPGDIMELVLMFREYPLLAVSVTAHVEGVNRGIPATRQGTAYKLRFATMNTDDREILIQYLFQEERRQIRAQKFFETPARRD